MKHVDKIGSILSQPITGKEFELRHQFKMLKLEIAKLENKLMNVNNDKVIMEHHLNSTIKDLEKSNLEIRQLRRKELLKNEKLLRLQASRLEQITHAMTSSMAYIDKNYVYQYINHMYEVWFGKPKEHFLGKTVEDVVGEEFFKKVKPFYDKVFQGEKFSFELEGTYQDERLVTKVQYVPAYDDEGNNIGAYLYGLDVTENKIIEEEIRNSKIEISETNEKLKEYIESNIQLEQFAHIAAHDMKAPLRSISSFAKLIRKKVNSNVESKLNEYFTIIDDSTKSLNNLITKLLDYSKVGTKELEISKVNIEEMTTKILTFLKSSIVEKEATIIIDSLPNELFCDKTRIHQLFQNLISNALKFTKPDLKPIIKISSSESINHWEFEIKDNGIGIETNHINKIFESFTKLHSKNEFEGTGLGLSICKKIVDLHQGEIRAKSQLGYGSKFIFSIAKNLGSQ